MIALVLQDEFDGLQFHLIVPVHDPPELLVRRYGDDGGAEVHHRSGTHDPKDIFINPLGWYTANAITLHAGVKVTAIDRAKQEVVAGNGLRVRYDQLVLATGSRAFVPPRNCTVSSSAQIASNSSASAG